MGQLKRTDEVEHGGQCVYGKKQNIVSTAFCFVCLGKKKKSNHVRCHKQMRNKRYLELAGLWRFCFSREKKIANAFISLLYQYPIFIIQTQIQMSFN